jgi:twitching motility protein PilT
VFAPTLTLYAMGVSSCDRAQAREQVSLVPSLLQAIVRADGEALVLHAGDKPYVVSPTGQVELATSGLTLEAVNNIVNQLLPPALQQALEEFGAVLYELPALAEFPNEHFTIVVARGGDDVWTEIRRRRVADDDRVPDEFFGTSATAPAVGLETATAAFSSMLEPEAVAFHEIVLTDEPEPLDEDEVAAGVEKAAQLEQAALQEAAESDMTDEALVDDDLVLPASTLLWPGRTPPAVLVEDVEEDHAEVEPEVNIKAATAAPEPPLVGQAAPPPAVVAEVQPPPPAVVAEVRPSPPAVVAEVQPPPPAVAAEVRPPPPAVVAEVRPPPPAVVAEVQPPPPAVVAEVRPPPLAVVEEVRPPPPAVVADIQPPPPAVVADIDSPRPAVVADIRPKPLAVVASPQPPPPTVADVRPPPQRPMPLPPPQPTPTARPLPPEQRLEPPPRVAPPPALPIEPRLATSAPPRLAPPPQPAVVLPISRSPIRLDPPPPAVADPTLSGLDRLLRLSAARGASTLYLSSESRSSVRVDGELHVLDGEPVLTARDVESLLLTLMPERSHEALRTGAATEWICDIEDVGRVRCMSFRDHRGPGGVFRLMPTRSVSAEQIGLPPQVQSLASEPEGLVLVAGPRSSGKRTLISAFVDLMNKTRRDHVITIEREINIVHERGNSFISQREVRGNDDDMLAAARAALREDPDVLVIEDLRTGALMNVALEAAASGHLVIGGFSADTATGAIDRIIDLYAPEYRRQVQIALAASLRGVVVQVLLRKTGGGRLPAREVLLNTPSVSSLIAEGKTSQLPMVIEGGRPYGMMPLNDTLVGLVQSGAVDGREAYRHSPDRPGFLAALTRQGIDTTFAERFG